MTSEALTLDEQREAVRRACRGTYPNHGQCVSCVAHQRTSVTPEFAQGECKDQCIKTSCAIEGKTCGTVDDGCGGSLSCGPPCSGLMLLPAENDALYDVRAVCTLRPVSRVGTADACCREAVYTTDTTCTTTLHEEIDAAGKFALRIDPMSGCAPTNTPTSCNRTGTLARCDSAGLTCPLASYQTLGNPLVLQGDYVRSIVQNAAVPTMLEEYRGWCGTSPMIGVAGPFTCSLSPALVVNRATWHVTTFSRKAPGTFTARREVGTVNPGATFCSDVVVAPTPRFPVAQLAGFTSGGPATGGSFNITNYDCTYEFTLRP